jgi:transcriptional regulator with XRE-family HTH domain
MMCVITKKVGCRVNQLRQALGLSQEKFALQIGMDRTYLASVEAGKRNISIINLEKIINGLNVSLAEFFDCPFFESEKE